MGGEGDAGGLTVFAEQPVERVGGRACGELNQGNTEFGESGDIGQDDFYFYDIEEPAFGLGFAYTW